MQFVRAAGTLAAAGAGGAVVAGGLATGTLSPSVAAAAGVPLGATVAYLVGDRRFPVVAAALVYLGVGAAMLGDAIVAPTPTGAAFLGVGTILSVGYLLRWRTGNARRLATLPIDPGRRRRLGARVGRLVLGIQSPLGRVAGVSLGPLKVGTVFLVGAWAATAIGLVVLAGEVPPGTDAVVEAALLVVLAVPFYLGTDWSAVDDPQPRVGGELRERLRAVSAGFVEDRSREQGATTGTIDTEDVEVNTPDRTTPLYRGGGGTPPGSDGDDSTPDAHSSTGRTVARHSDDLSERRRTDPSSTGEGNAGSEGSSDDAAGEGDGSEDELQELPSVGEMGPAGLAGGNDGKTESEAETDGDDDAETDPPTSELGVLDRVTELLEDDAEADDAHEDREESSDTDVGVDWMEFDDEGTTRDGDRERTDDRERTTGGRKETDDEDDEDAADGE